MPIPFGLKVNSLILFPASLHHCIVHATNYSLVFEQHKQQILWHFFQKNWPHHRLGCLPFCGLCDVGWWLMYEKFVGSFAWNLIKISFKVLIKCRWKRESSGWTWSGLWMMIIIVTIDQIGDHHCHHWSDWGSSLSPLITCHYDDYKYQRHHR